MQTGSRRMYGEGRRREPYSKIEERASRPGGRRGTATSEQRRGRSHVALPPYAGHQRAEPRTDGGTSAAAEGRHRDGAERQTKNSAGKRKHETERDPKKNRRRGRQVGRRFCWVAPDVESNRGSSVYGLRAQPGGYRGEPPGTLGECERRCRPGRLVASEARERAAQSTHAQP